jgi:hypothetical protein
MSAKKRTSLEAVFGGEDLPAARRIDKRREKIAMEEPPTAAEEIPSEGRGGASKRPNFKQHTAYLRIPVHEQLRKLAFEEDGKIHDYLIEGLDLVFAKRGLPSIRDLS